MSDRRLMVFGIDSATLDLVRPWVEHGDLPTLGRLMRTGIWGPLRSVPNMITPAAWTSFATGCNPGKHGVYFFTEPVPGSYVERFITGATRALPAFWKLMGGQGIRTTVLNVPMTYPADPVHGVMISGMDAPSVDAPGFTHPPGLAAELKQRFAYLLGPSSLSGAIGHLMLAGKLDDALAVLEKRVEARTDLAGYLMARYPSDLFVLVHTEVDGVQHYFWKYIDPRVPGYSPRLARRVGDGILRLYRKVDQSLDTLLAAYGPASVVVMSDHGAGASPGVEDGVPWIRLVLEALGLSVRHADRGTLRRTSRGAAAALYRTVNPRLPGIVRHAVRRWVPVAKAIAKASVAYQYDWQRTRAFCRGAPGDVWINVRGREAEGVVEPGAEYEQTRNRIREAFLALRDAWSGEPVVEAVEYREEVYDGPFVERAPDLFIRFRDVVINGLVMNGKVLQLPRRGAASPKELKSGSHRPDGLLILAGAGVQPGNELIGARLLDIAPTLLYLMDQPVPSYVDGRVLTEVFTSEFLAANPVKRVTMSIEASRSGTGYTREEEALVTERLRGLGYV